MSHATVEKKYMCMQPPRYGATGCIVADVNVKVADLTEFCSGPGGGDSYVFFQADGADLYIMSAPSAGLAANMTAGSEGSPGIPGSPGGSIPLVQGGSTGGRLYAGAPQRYILEPKVDMYFGFQICNQNYTGGPVYFRWWRASMLSNG